MILIDTHSHLYEPEFDADRDEAIARTAAAGVEKLLMPAIDSASHDRLFNLCRRHPDRCIPMMGLHPTSINDNSHWREELATIERYLRHPPEGIARFCAIGEIGLDFYWSTTFRNEQFEAFRRQCSLAVELNLPVAIHTRNAYAEMLELIREFRGSGLRGVFHAFSEDAETFRALADCGDWLFGIGGVVTFKKSTIAESIREMPLDRLVLETDCPFLTPVPHRGERNESAYVAHICRRIAELKGCPAAEVAERTTRNAQRMFAI